MLQAYTHKLPAVVYETTYILHTHTHTYIYIYILAPKFQPNLLGFLLLVPPNFSLVESDSLTIKGRIFFPSAPNIAFVTASLPCPNPLYANSSFWICGNRPLS